MPYLDLRLIYGIVCNMGLQDLEFVCPLQCVVVAC